MTCSESIGTGRKRSYEVVAWIAAGGTTNPVLFVAEEVTDIDPETEVVGTTPCEFEVPVEDKGKSDETCVEDDAGGC
jgi:hypothetical protein